MTEFDLFVEADGDGGACSLLAVSSEGVARERSTVPLGDEAFNDQRVRVAGREKNIQVREQFGKQLFDLVFRGDILAAWAKASASADGVRLRLVIEASALATLPWELLNDGLNFLATDARLAISRYIPVPEPPRVPVIDTLKVLLVTASPGPLPVIPTTEVDALADVIREAGTVTVVPHCTGKSLADAIAAHDCDVVHYLGHGAKGSLLLEGPTSADFEAVSERALAQMVFGRPSIRLVVLSACSSAQTADAGAFSGVGPALIRTRVPAVIAMQYEFVQLSTAQAFNRAFYAEIGRAVPVDVAVNRARNAISASGDLLAQRDWSTPVLYLGTRNGRLITLEREQAATVEKAAQSVQAAAMQSTAAAEGWRELQDTFETLRASHLALAGLAAVREIVNQAGDDFDPIVTTAAHGIGAAEFDGIKRDWNRMNSGSVAKLRNAAAGLTDASAKAAMQSVVDRFRSIDAAIAALALGDLEKEIAATRRALADETVAISRRIDATIADLLTASERTLGRLSAKA